MKKSPAISTLIRSLALLAVLPAANATAATITFSDGTFASSDWLLSHDEQGASGATLTPGYPSGNPAPSIRYSGTLGGDAGDYAIMGGAYIASSYDAGVQGAIISIDVALDTRNVSPSPVSPDPFGYLYFVLHQDINGDGNFEAFSLSPSSPDGISGSWTTSSHTGLTASAFFDELGQHPDFSSSGGEIFFGFAGGAPTLGNDFGGPVAFDYRFDNWTATVRAVPEPSTAFLLATGLVGLAVARRRRS